MKKKVAIIGAGQVAEKVHVFYYNTREELDVIAIVDPNQERVREFAERNNIPHYFTSAEEMYAAIQPDIVSICTPNRSHCENVLLAIANRCDVMCEKPPAITAAEAMAMRDAAAANDCLLAYDFHHIFAEDVAFVQEQYKQGALGEVYVTKVKAMRRCGIPGWGSFTKKDIQGGGPLIDLGAHMLDVAFYVLGFPKIKRVSAKMYQKIGTKKSKGTLGEWDPNRYEVEDSLFGFIELEDGGLVQLETSFALNVKETSVMNVEFCGDEAGATLYPAQIYTDKDGELSYLFKKESADSDRHHKSMMAFIDRCLGEEVMVADGEQGFYIQQLIEALYQSAEKGESVTL